MVCRKNEDNFNNIDTITDIVVHFFTQRCLLHIKSNILYYLLFIYIFILLLESSHRLNWTCLLSYIRHLCWSPTRDLFPWAPHYYSTCRPPEMPDSHVCFLRSDWRLRATVVRFWPDLYLAVSVHSDLRKGAKGTHCKMQRPRAKGWLYTSDEEDLQNELWSGLIDFFKALSKS